MNKYFFITGTDTNIGKTIISCGILEAISKMGYHAIGYKPIASKCKLNLNGKKNNDVLKLIKHSNIKLNYNKHNTISFNIPSSPNIVSKKEMKNINLNNFSKNLNLLKNYAEWIIIEGIGGWLTPINNKLNMSDWVIKEKLSVIIVVDIKLGCINHALLTSIVIKNLKINLVGWIANNTILKINKFIYKKEIIKTINKKLKIPMLGNIPYIDNYKKLSIVKYLNILKLIKL